MVTRWGWAAGLVALGLGAGCAPSEGPAAGDTASAMAEDSTPRVGGICNGGPVRPNTRRPSEPVDLAVDGAFTPAEAGLIAGAFAAWGVSVRSWVDLPAEAPVPPGHVAVARCARVPGDPHAAGAHRGGVLALVAPVVTPGLVAHEVGHLLGFGHSDDAGDVMHSPVRASAPSARERAAYVAAAEPGM